MMNLAAQYELQQRYDTACKWYKIAMIIKPTLKDAYYGYGLCQFKAGRPEDASDHLTIGIELLQGVDIRDRALRHLIYFRYLRSLCYRVMGHFEKSQQDYKSILRAFEIEEGHRFGKYIFAMILMPTSTNRKKTLEYVDGFKSIIEMFETDCPKENAERVVLRNSFLTLMDRSNVYIGENKHPKWLDKQIPKVIQTLRNRPFFRRFPLKTTVEMVEVMELTVIKRKDLLFFENHKVYVIVSGNILMKNHEENMLCPETQAKFREGDILNFM